MLTYIDTDDIRGLECTAILFWDSERIEHVALRAAELGDTVTESLCDSALAGDVQPEVLAYVLDQDERYRTWIERGNTLGWQARVPS